MAHPRQRKKNKKKQTAQKSRPAASPQPQRPASVPPSKTSLPAQMKQAHQQIDVEGTSNPWLPVIALVGTALFMFVYYHLIALQQMGDLVGGLAMLDQRVTGYGFEAVKELSAAMDEPALGQLNWTHKTAGIIFPIMFGLAAAAVIGLVVPARAKRTWLTGRPVKIAVWSVIGVFVIVDIVENFLIEAVLAQPDPTLAAIAAVATVSRWILLFLIVGYALIAFVASKLRNFVDTAGRN